MNGCVYLLCDPSTNLFKIGMTRSAVGKRMKQLQTGNSAELHMVNKFDTTIPFFIESSLHHHFQAKKQLNEWYALDINDVTHFEETCQHYHNVAEMMQDNPFFKYKL